MSLKHVSRVNHPMYDATISVALFSSANEQIKTLRKNVMNGDLSVALLKPSVVIDIFPVLVAANKAIHFQKSSTMTTKNVHSEILFCLSPTRNITESFKMIGTSDTDSNVMIVIVDDKEDSRMTKVCEILGTEPCSMDTLKEFSDEKLIAKMYKITDQEMKTYSLSDSTTAHIAAKEIYMSGKVK